MSGYRMTLRVNKIAAFILTAAVLAGHSAFAEDKKEDKDVTNDFQFNVITTKTGLQFRVPDDMPIETRNGVEAPLPFDEYVYGKFKKLDDRLSRIEKSLQNIEKSVANLKPQTPANSDQKPKP